MGITPKEAYVQVSKGGMVLNKSEVGRVYRCCMVRKI